MNKKISFPIALIIIVVLATLVGGLAIWQYSWAPKIEISEFEPAEKIQPENETANWKTYINEEHGYEIKYPESWFVYEIEIYEKQNLPVVYFQPEEEAEILYEKYPGIMMAGPHSLAASIIVFDNPSNLTLKEWVAEEAGSKNQKEVIVGGETGIEVKFSGLPYVYIVKESKIYRFASGIPRSKKKDEIKDEIEIFNQMLSTFRFLE